EWWDVELMQAGGISQGVCHCAMADEMAQLASGQNLARAACDMSCSVLMAGTLAGLTSTAIRTALGTKSSQIQQPIKDATGAPLFSGRHHNLDEAIANKISADAGAHWCILRIDPSVPYRIVRLKVAHVCEPNLGG